MAIGDDLETIVTYDERMIEAARLLGFIDGHAGLTARASERGVFGTLSSAACRSAARVEQVKDSANASMPGCPHVASTT